MSSWHHDRDGFGTVLGGYEHEPAWCCGYPVLGHGYTYEEAVAKFGPLQRVDTSIPVTIDVPSEDGAKR